MMLPTSPYSSHSIPNSSFSTRSSECACERRTRRPESRSLAGAVHLIKKSSIGRSQHKKYILRTPALHDACEESLFRIVRDVGAKPVDDLSEMAIREANNLWGCHAKLK
jgi:hypothetical protein